VTGRPVARVARLLGIGQATVYRERGPRASRYHLREDLVVYQQLRSVLRERGSYGYRRATVVVNRSFGTRYNRKRIRRVMRLTGLALAVRRRAGNRRPHRGIVAMPGSNQRWCSDKMTIVCRVGEVVELGFAVDCHDREPMAVVAEARAIDGADIRRLMRHAAFARFGNQRPAEPVQWLSDNEAIYTALETVIPAERLNLVPITTSAERLLAPVPGWIAGHITFAPHSSLWMKSPASHRSRVPTHDAETCLTK